MLSYKVQFITHLCHGIRNTTFALALRTARRFAHICLRLLLTRRLLKFSNLPHLKKTENSKWAHAHISSALNTRNQEALGCSFNTFSANTTERNLTEHGTAGSSSNARYSALLVPFLQCRTWLFSRQLVTSQLVAGCRCAVCKLTLILSILIIKGHPAFESCAYWYHLVASHTVREHPSGTVTQQHC